MKTSVRIIRSPTVVFVLGTRSSLHAPTSPAIENSQHVTTVLQDCNGQPTKPRRQISREIDRLLHVTALELMSGNGVKVWKDILVCLDHLDLDRILLPTLMRHVGIDLVEDQMILMVVVDRRGGKRREEGALRFRMIDTKRVDKKMNRTSQIVTRLFRKPCDQCDCRLDAVTIGALDPLPSLIEIEFLVDDVLQSL